LFLLNKKKRPFAKKGPFRKYLLVCAGEPAYKYQDQDVFQMVFNFNKQPDSWSKFLLSEINR